MSIAHAGSAAKSTNLRRDDRMLDGREEGVPYATTFHSHQYTQPGDARRGTTRTQARTHGARTDERHGQTPGLPPSHVPSHAPTLPAPVGSHAPAPPQGAHARRGTPRRADRAPLARPAKAENAAGERAIHDASIPCGATCELFGWRK